MKSREFDIYRESLSWLRLRSQNFNFASLAAAFSLHFILYLDLTAALFSHSTYADEACGSTVQLDDVGGSMENVPPLNQESLPICYAFSAAEMLQSWRCSHGATDCKDTLVSPVAIAVNAELFEVNHHTATVTGPAAQTSPFWSYNREQITAAALFQGPFCDQTSLQSLPQASATRLEIDSLFAQYKKNCINITPWNGGLASPSTASCRMMDGITRDHQSFESLVQKAQSCLFEEGMKDPGGKPIDLQLIENALVNSDPLLIIQGEISDTCNKHPITVPAMPRLDFYEIRPQDGATPDDSRMDAAKKAIDAKFDRMDKKGQPVFVTYCGDVLSSGKNFMPAYGRNCSGAHASLIIGRRKDPKSGNCQFLVRNSWGKTCDRDINHPYHYSPDWECIQNQGDYWIDQQTLLKATLEIGGVEKEGIGSTLPASMLTSKTNSF